MSAASSPREAQPASPADKVAEKAAEKEKDGALSDAESDVLSEIDEDQFEDYDPATARVGATEIDESAVRSLKAARRKPGTGGDAAPKKKREKKRSRAAADDADVHDGADGEIVEGKRVRKSRGEGGSKRSKKASPESDEDDENLTPEERRKRALDRAFDEALRGGQKRRRKKDEVDLEDQIDEIIASLKTRMEKACLADNEARESGRPAIHKLKLLPEVVAMLNRDNAQDAVLDPESNFLQSVKFFLEPLNDGSLPAYNIQRDIFSALVRLPIEKEALISSGIGKVVLFYTKSRRPEPAIKRMAERLVAEWSRPILKRTDDYKKRHVETRDLDPTALKLAQRNPLSQMTLTQRPAAGSQSGGLLTASELERERALAPVVANPNRARIVGLPESYTVAPRSTFDPASQAPSARPLGASGIEAFRKMTSKGKKRH